MHIKHSISNNINDNTETSSATPPPQTGLAPESLKSRFEAALSGQVAGSEHVPVSGKMPHKKPGKKAQAPSDASSSAFTNQTGEEARSASVSLCEKVQSRQQTRSKAEPSPTESHNDSVKPDGQAKNQPTLHTGQSLPAKATSGKPAKVISKAAEQNQQPGAETSAAGKKALQSSETLQVKQAAPAEKATAVSRTAAEAVSKVKPDNPLKEQKSEPVETTEQDPQAVSHTNVEVTRSVTQTSVVIPPAGNAKTGGEMKTTAIHPAGPKQTEQAAMSQSISKTPAGSPAMTPEHPHTSQRQVNQQPPALNAAEARQKEEDGESRTAVLTGLNTDSEEHTHAQTPAVSAPATQGDLILKNIATAATPAAAATKELAQLVSQLVEKIHVSLPQAGSGQEVRLTLSDGQLKGGEIQIKLDNQGYTVTVRQEQAHQILNQHARNELVERLNRLGLEQPVRVVITSQMSHQQDQQQSRQQRSVYEEWQPEENQ